MFNFRRYSNITHTALCIPEAVKQSGTKTAIKATVLIAAVPAVLLTANEILKRAKDVVEIAEAV